jgi:hypothetical protein
MSVKSQLKVIASKSWKAFNTWRKKAMWFRVTVLALIFSAVASERLMTPDHVPLINEFVWIACRAIRYGSEPKVTSAHLRYLHVQNSRKLQQQLLAEYQDGHIKLNSSELKLLKQNTLNANYNQLFKLAQAKGLINQNITLSQSKRAILNKACKLTADRYDAEWEDVWKRTRKEYHFKTSVIWMKLKILGDGLMAVLPFPLHITIPWFVLCLTAGYWGAYRKRQIYWICATLAVIIFTQLWIIEACHGKYGWIYKWNHGRIIGINIFFAIWALIGTINGKRLRKLAEKYKKTDIILISMLLLSSIILLIPSLFFSPRYFFYYWMFPGGYLVFRNLHFAPYFAVIAALLMLSALFYIHQKFSRTNKLAITVKSLIIVTLLAKLTFSLYSVFC